jgi:hypothetical protein
MAASPPRIAICIVGQLSRLELDSKIHNVLHPTAGLKPAALRVFLALEVGPVLYSNLDFGAILAQQHGSCHKQLSRSELKAKLHPWFGAADLRNHTTRGINMAKWPRYRRDRPSRERETRMQHHLSQFAHMRTCAQLIQAHEVAEGFHFDMVLKMRDNTLAISPIALSAAHVPGRARSKACIEWGGYNDKVMLIPRRFMDGALRAPSEDFFLTKG